MIKSLKNSVEYYLYLYIYNGIIKYCAFCTARHETCDCDGIRARDIAIRRGNNEKAPSLVFGRLIIARSRGPVRAIVGY